MTKVQLIIIMKILSWPFLSFLPTLCPNKIMYLCIHMFPKRLICEHFKCILTPQVNPVKFLVPLAQECIFHFWQIAHNCSEGFVIIIIQTSLQKKMDNELKGKYDCSSLWILSINFYYLVTNASQQYIYIYNYFWFISISNECWLDICFHW